MLMVVSRIKSRNACYDDYAKTYVTCSMFHDDSLTHGAMTIIYVVEFTTVSLSLSLSLHGVVVSMGGGKEGERRGERRTTGQTGAGVRR